jgi:uncharacterized membrane protein YfcA
MMGVTRHGRDHEAPARVTATDLSGADLLMVAGVTLLASGAHGILGFAFGMLATPALVLLLPAKQVVVLTVLLMLVLNGFVLVPARRAVRGDELWRVLGGVLLGLPVGAWILSVVRPATLTAVVGAAVIVLGVAALSGRSGAACGLARLPAVAGLAGLAGGVLTTSINFNAPPVVLYLSTRGLDAGAMRATTAAYLMVAHAAAVAVFAAAGLLGWDVVTLALGLSPVAAAGAWLGSRLAARLDTRAFGRLALAVVILMGMVAILSSGLLG